MSSVDRLTINVSRVSYETIDGEVVIINFENGNYYSLLGCAAEIWSMIESAATTKDIVEAVGRRYSGDRSDMETAIIKFVEDLRAEELVVHDNGHVPERVPGPRFAIEPKGGDVRPAFAAPALNKYTDVQDLLMLCPVHEADETAWPAPKLTADE